MRITAIIEKIGNMKLDNDGFEFHWDNNGIKCDVELTPEEVEYCTAVLSGEIPSKILPPVPRMRFGNVKTGDC